MSELDEREEAMKDTVDARLGFSTFTGEGQFVPPAPRCDCPALDIPHTHEPGGPEPIAGLDAACVADDHCD